MAEKPNPQYTQDALKHWKDGIAAFNAGNFQKGLNKKELLRFDRQHYLRSGHWVP
jgi:hypothetical protein